MTPADDRLLMFLSPPGPSIICFQAPPVKKIPDKQTPGVSEGLAKDNQITEDAVLEYRTGQHIFENRPQSTDPSTVSASSSGKKKGQPTSPSIDQIASVPDPLFQSTEDDLVPNKLSITVLSASGTDSKCHQRTVQPPFSPSSYHHAACSSFVLQNILAVSPEKSPIQGTFPLNQPVNYFPEFEDLPETQHRFDPSETRFNPAGHSGSPPKKPRSLSAAFPDDIHAGNIGHVHCNTSAAPGDPEELIPANYSQDFTAPFAMLCKPTGFKSSTTPRNPFRQ
ncbi:hypothetical protein BDW59DRAFT_168176 [Aspergillus cavernicola]|uniref:Uncharacterized protein n=1 Tax=Aspergillus cavernicola TaxID=176166 RepID=A0ABR4H3T2_9EURO